MDRTTEGWVNGMLGVLLFSGSLPATRVAVADFDPIFLTAARAGIAGVLAAGLLLAFRQRPPRCEDLASLAMIAAGVVIGFPLLTAFALEHTTAARSTVFVGLLPLATAIFGVWRGGERPQASFWLFAGLGALLVAGFALLAQRHAASPTSDMLMVAAVAICGLGYAEGGRLSRRLGGWQVISWALVVALPVMLTLAVATRPSAFFAVRPSAWLGLAYVSIISMLVGFVFWYRGLALGGIATVGQLQLMQPFLGLLVSAILLHEAVPPSMVAVALGVVVCVAGAKRFAGRHPIVSDTALRDTA